MNAAAVAAESTDAMPGDPTLTAAITRRAPRCMAIAGTVAKVAENTTAKSTTLITR